MVLAVSLLELGGEQRGLYQSWLVIDPRNGLLYVVHIRGQEEGLRKDLRIEERRDDLPHGMERRAAMARAPTGQGADPCLCLARRGC